MDSLLRSRAREQRCCRAWCRRCLCAPLQCIPFYRDVILRQTGVGPASKRAERGIRRLRCVLEGAMSAIPMTCRRLAIAPGLLQWRLRRWGMFHGKAAEVAVATDRACDRVG